MVGKGQHAAGTVDTTVAEIAAWGEGLARLAVQIGQHFVRVEPRQRVGAYLRGLLAPVERKNGWQLAEHAGEATPDGVQRLVSTAAWDVEAVRDDLRAYVVEHLGDPEAVLVVDETGFLKKGTKSVGVKRQYSGTAGRIENCQIGVFLGYAGGTGYAFVDRELYLPKDWVADDARRREAGVPTAVTLQTKGQLAQTMLARAVAAGVPHAWITGDECYGSDGALRRWLEEHAEAYVLAVRANTYLWSASATGLQQQPLSAIAPTIPDTAWTLVSCGDGAQGPRLFEWAWAQLPYPTAAGWAKWVLVRRRCLEPTALAYYLVFGPATTTLAQVVWVAGRRWTIETGLEQAKGEVGLDQYEVRRWAGWYRHLTLALLAHAFLAVTRAHANATSAKGGNPRAVHQAPPHSSCPRNASSRSRSPRSVAC